MNNTKLLHPRFLQPVDKRVEEAFFKVEHRINIFYAYKFGFFTKEEFEKELLFLNKKMRN